MIFRRYFSEDSPNDHAFKYHVVSHHHSGPLLDGPCHVLIDPSPSEYGIVPLSTLQVLCQVLIL